MKRRQFIALLRDDGHRWLLRLRRERPRGSRAAQAPLFRHHPRLPSDLTVTPLEVLRRYQAHDYTLLGVLASRARAIPEYHLFADARFRMQERTGVLRHRPEPSLDVLLGLILIPVHEKPP
jgi:hypothetical protein